MPPPQSPPPRLTVRLGSLRLTGEVPMSKRPRRGLDFDDVCEIARAFPGVEVGSAYGTPALRELVEQEWRRSAPKKLVAEHDRRPAR